MQSAKLPELVVTPAARPVNAAPTATERQEEDEDPNPTIPEEHAYNELKSLISKHDRWLDKHDRWLDKLDRPRRDFLGKNVAAR